MKRAKVFVLFLALAVTVAGCRLFRKESKTWKNEERPLPVVEKSVLQFSEDNPYVYLIPRTDGHALNLYASRFGEAKHLEYELTYKTGAQLQGAIGRFELKGERVGPEEILLGTCSKGVCKYDEGVSEGTLKLKFLHKDVKEEETWETDFRLQSLDVDGENISSRDGKFTLEIPPGNCSVFVLTMPLLGLPGILGKEIIGYPYGVFTPVSPTFTKDAAVSFLFFTLPDDFEKFTIFGWSEGEWIEYETVVNVSEKKLTAKVDRLAPFVVAKKS